MSRESQNRAAALRIASIHNIPARSVDIWHPINAMQYPWNDGTRHGVICVASRRVYITDKLSGKSYPIEESK